MSKQPKKKSGEKIKMVMSLEIHSLHITLPETCELFIEVQRGKDLKTSTEKHEYDPSAPHISLNSKFSAHITMQKKGKKYKKKTLKFKVFQSSSPQQLGSISIDLSPIPALKKPISRREISFSSPSSDQPSSITLSLSLSQVLNTEPFSSNLTAKNLPKPEFSEDVDSDNESVSSRMSFSDAILHPKESEILSESSSSEEEYKQLPVDKLIAAAPKASMESVKPNERSRNMFIDEKEEKAGIATKRETGNCVNCEIV